MSGFIGLKTNTFENAIEALSENMQSLIDYLEATEADEWYLHKVRNKTNTKNCLYGHVVNWYYGKDYPKEGSITPIWDAFEEVGSTFYVYPINDGKNPNYPQKTARERCIAYLKNIRDGKELWTWEGMEKEMNDTKKHYEGEKDQKGMTGHRDMHPGFTHFDDSKGGRCRCRDGEEA